MYQLSGCCVIIYSGAGTVPTASDCGAEFFGLAHPTVQYLIQSCAGARKCVNYRCARFELSHGEADTFCEEDASVNASLFPVAVTSAIALLPEPAPLTLAATSVGCRPTLQSSVLPS